MPQDREIKKPGLKLKLRKQLGKSQKVVACYESLIFIKRHPKKSKLILLSAAKRLFSRKKYIFLFASPTSGNRGDHLIATAMKQWSEKYFPNHVFIEYDDGILSDWSVLNLLKRLVKKRDLILIRGGGSVGDWYIDYEYFIRYLLKRFPKNKIVMFPQSIRFSKTAKGREEKLKTAAAYDSHPNLTLYARDEQSFEIACGMFEHTKVLLCPDIAMLLFGSFEDTKICRNGVLFCLRSDVQERFYSDHEREAMVQTVKALYPVDFCDTEAGHRIPLENREKEIEELLNCFAKSKVLVTDRFHGVISAVLTKTPCVVLRSADHKIPSGLLWFKDVEPVFYAENTAAVPELIKKALASQGVTGPNFGDHFQKIAEDIIYG